MIGCCVARWSLLLLLILSGWCVARLIDLQSAPPWKRILIFTVPFPEIQILFETCCILICTVPFPETRIRTWKYFCKDKNDQKKPVLDPRLVWLTCFLKAGECEWANFLLSFSGQTYTCSIYRYIAYTNQVPFYWGLHHCRFQTFRSSCLPLASYLNLFIILLDYPCLAFDWLLIPPCILLFPYK